MKIIGIGTDIVNIARIQEVLGKHGARFANRVLHEQEQQRFGEHAQPHYYLAKRFAAKEALAKALGTGIGKAAQMGEIETFNTDSGQPRIRLHGKTAEYAKRSGVSDIHLSLSDEQDYALAYVVLTGN